MPHRSRTAPPVLGTVPSQRSPLSGPERVDQSSPHGRRDYALPLLLYAHIANAQVRRHLRVINLRLGFKLPPFAPRKN